MKIGRLSGYVELSVVEMLDTTSSLVRKKSLHMSFLVVQVTQQHGYISELVELSISQMFQMK
jgi:hypothetical protein